VPSLWNLLRQKLATPHVDESQLTERLKRVRQDLPIPVFWLLGKAQSGKTSLIRALTGSSRAEIGNGFRPCTRTAQLYPFPNQEECFLKFLDTRGIGEAAYDPTEDMQAIEKQAHLIVVVVRAMDHAAQSVLTPLKKVLRAHPHWPVIVVQTALHEGYPQPATQHILPYPYSEFPFPPHVPADLARSLSAQQTWFAGRQVRFVPVDFTLPGDGYTPEH
jgi:hypothetical protein